MEINRGAHPIGTVLQSMLSVEQFQSLMGIGWVLMNGQSCVGTAYGTYTGFTSVPDARGAFLRCKDHGVGRNSEGDTALGTYQGDSVQNHTHAVNVHYTENGNGAYQGNIQGYGFTGPYGSGGTSTMNSGNASSETRVKNVTVNFFIKVN